MSSAGSRPGLLDNGSGSSHDAGGIVDRGAGRPDTTRDTNGEATRDGDGDGGPAGELTIRLGARSVTAAHRRGTTLLQAARLAGLRPPSSCETGTCGTCMAQVVEGRAEMRNNDVLEDDEVAEGWVLTCQAEPRTPTVSVVYE